jgi:hypothetical protein
MRSKKGVRYACGSLSKTAKMPGFSYSLPATRCPVGRRLRQLPDAVCSHCYALRGRYNFPNVLRAMEKRLESIEEPQWVQAMTDLISASRNRYFRWHDSGDIQNQKHLRKIIEVCTRLPYVKFWLPTKEHTIVEAYRKAGGVLPKNLCVRYSAHFIDAPPPLQFGMPVSSVSTAANAPAGAYRCPAARKRECGRCRACWNSKIRIVDFLLKWRTLKQR